MIQWFFLFSCVTLGFIFAQMMHPLAMGLLLLLQTLLIALITGFMAPTFWFSYVLFLVFLGGMLVLFIYVTSLASNEMFSMSALMLVSTFGFCITYLVMISFIDPLFTPLPLLPDLIFSTFPLSLVESSLTHLVKLYHSPSTLLTLLLVLYLFLTLIAVVTITNIHEGPLRTRN